MRRPPKPCRSIAVDTTCLGSGRGYARFARELLPRLVAADRGSRYTLIADSHVEGLDVEGASVATPVLSEHQADATSNGGSRPLRDLWRLRAALRDLAPDLVFFPTVFSYYPVPSGIPVVLGIHDTIPESHGEVVFPDRLSRWRWRAKALAARRRADVYVTVSEWSRRRLVDRFGLPEDRIFVAPEAASDRFYPDPSVPTDEASVVTPYLVYVGGFNPHKNLSRLLEAFARVSATPGTDRLELLLVGDPDNDPFHDELPEIRQRIARLGLERHVRFTGFVGDDELRRLYSDARAVVLPALQEGFGLPAVEAAACRTPCIATDCSPLPEVLDGGGLFFDPTSEPELATAIGRLVGDPDLREELAAAALVRATALSWESAAEGAQRAFDAALGGRS